MTISIPDSVKELVDQEVASGAFPSAEDYIRALVEADQKRKGLDRLEALIMEGLDSPLSEMTAQDWEDIRREGLAEIRSRSQNPHEMSGLAAGIAASPSTTIVNGERMQYTFTLHEDAWLRDGPVFASGKVTGYRVGGMPDGSTAKIANFGAPNRNDWRIIRIRADNTQTEWTGHYESVDAALAALQSDH